MDYGIPLGRCFRCLKLWFALKYHGVNYYIDKIQQHLKYAQVIYQSIEKHPEFEIMSPQPLSTTCFRAIPKNPKNFDSYNETLMDAVNATGSFFISHTKLNDKFVLRHVVSGGRIEERHLKDFLFCLFNIKTELDAI